MTSLEIAELTQKEHKNVLADIRKLLDELKLDSAEFSAQYKDSTGRSLPCFSLPRREVEILLTGYSIPLRARVIDRLRELERPHQKAVPLSDVTAALEIAARMLNACESSKLQMLGTAFKRHGVDPVGLLPAYAIDAPPISAGSSEATFALSVLLKKHGIQISAAKVNQLLIEHGLLETKARPSSKGGVKEFKAVTEKGLEFGKNVTSPSSPRETQPHWYEHRFQQLMGIVGL